MWRCKPLCTSNLCLDIASHVLSAQILRFISDGKDLTTLSTKGHFLKGSSGSLGVKKVQELCERMQHYGHLRDEEENADLTPEAALKKIVELHSSLKVEYAVAEKWLKDYFE